MQFKRKDRVGDQIKKEVSQIIQRELKDPGIGFVTITDVQLSSDLKNAKIFYSVLGDEQKKLDSGQALNRAVFFIQYEIGRKMRLKHTPKIKFVYDSSLEKGARIEKALEEIHHSENPPSKRKEKDNEG
ncbi:MAG: 30S ribosome-binding factor RbfA [Candidatus Zixiibacteriota bacterium]